MLKKRLPWALLSLGIAAAVIWTMVSQSSSFSFPALIHGLDTAKDIWLVAALAGMLGFILFEGLAIRCLVNGLTDNPAGSTGLLYSASDIFFSAITPSATGGQPACAFFMIRDGISAAAATVILLINLILYTLALLLLGCIGLILKPDALHLLDGLSKTLLVIGYAVLILLTALFVLLLMQEKIILKAAGFLIRLGKRLHLIRDETGPLEKLEATMLQFRASAQLAKRNPKVILTVFLLNLLQRLSQSLVTVAVYLALHGNPVWVFDVWSVQIMTMVASNTIPVPGAMGVADYLLIQGLEVIPGIPLEANLALLSRSISFYLCVLVSVVIIFFGTVRRKTEKRQKKEGNNCDWRL